MKISSFPEKTTLSDSDLVLITDSEDGNDTKNARVSAFVAAATVGGKRVIVTEASQLSGVLESDVQYFINGEINLADTTVTVPPSGLFIAGYGPGISRLYSAENSYSMFSGSGSLVINGLDIDVTGTGSKVFNLDNTGDGTGYLEATDVFFTGCTSIGDIEAYFQGLLRRVRMINCTGGINLLGVWAGGFYVDTFLGKGNSGIMFNGDTGLRISTRFFSNANIDAGDGCTVYNFTSVNFTSEPGLQLIDGNLTGAGTYLNGIDPSSPKIKIRDTAGLAQNFPIAQTTVVAEEPTTVSEIGVSIIMSMPSDVDKKTWFTNGLSNDITYDSSHPSDAIAQFNGSVESGNNNQIEVKLVKYDASADSRSDIAVATATTNGSGKLEHVSVMGYVDLDDGDVIELWAANNTSTSSITINNGSKVIIKTS